MRFLLLLIAVAALAVGCQRVMPLANSRPMTSTGSSQDAAANAQQSQRPEAQAGRLSQQDEDIAEVAVREIPLAGDIKQRSAELSGLAWYGDWLILLPQFPDFSGQQGDERIFALARADILAYLNGETTEPLQPVGVPFVSPPLRKKIRSYEGFEAITFDGDRAYLAIEASPGREMVGYLVAGTIAPDLSQLLLDAGRLAPLPSATGLSNKSEEALLLAGESVLVIHEANGARVNPAPVARRFDSALRPLPTLAFPTIEYRITDATQLDDDGRFWVINYFFPGEFALRTTSDPIADTYGEGPTHAARSGVARLLEMQYAEEGITLVDRPPIQLELGPLALHNWEGIVRLEDRGFLLVTDKFPDTILGFVPFP